MNKLAHFFNGSCVQASIVLLHYPLHVHAIVSETPPCVFRLYFTAVCTVTMWRHVKLRSFLLWTRVRGRLWLGNARGGPENIKPDGKLSHPETVRLLHCTQYLPTNRRDLFRLLCQRAASRHCAGTFRTLATRRLLAAF